MLTLETVNDFSELLCVEAEWSRFAHSLPGMTPFQLPDWSLTWWREFGSGELRVFVFRNGGEAAGIVPCFRHEWEGKRQITLIGSGISDYLEPAIACDRAQGVLEMLADALQRDRDWDVCVWQDLADNSALAALPSCGGLVTTVKPDTVCSEAELHGSFEGWWTQRPHGLRRNVRRYLQKARAIGEPEFCVTSKPDAHVLVALESLHAARWHRHNQEGMIAANRSAHFLAEACERFARADILRLFTLRFKNRIVAVICAFLYRETVFSYLSAFDPEYKILGFGRLLLFDSVKYAFECGYRAWNFLRGREPYKFDWGAATIPKSRVVVTRR